jgi:hypothetical protein
MNCKDVEIQNNSYTGNHDHFVRVDETTKPTLIVEGNQGF